MCKTFVVGWVGFLFAMVALASSQNSARSSPPVLDYHFPTYGPSSSLSPVPEPEDGQISNDVYVSDYFQLRFPLLAGFVEDMKGAVPSNAGHYSLVAIRGPATPGDKNSYAYIEAEDMFFSHYPIRGLADFAQRRENQVVNSLYEIDNPSRPIQLRGHQWMRLDYNGSGIYRTSFFTIIRCHAVTIDFSSPFPKVLRRLDDSMANLSLSGTGDLASGGAFAPVCIKGYASNDTVLHQVTPVMVGVHGTRVPARFVIDTNGKVKHIHVINAMPDQARSVEEALSQWVFKPYVLNGQAVEVETGLLFTFPLKGDILAEGALSSSN
jgi:hypothetical protein